MLLLQRGKNFRDTVGAFRACSRAFVTWQCFTTRLAGMILALKVVTTTKLYLLRCKLERRRRNIALMCKRFSLLQQYLSSFASFTKTIACRATAIRLKADFIFEQKYQRLGFHALRHHCRVSSFYRRNHLRNSLLFWKYRKVFYSLRWLQEHALSRQQRRNRLAAAKSKYRKARHTAAVRTFLVGATQHLSPEVPSSHSVVDIGDWRIVSPSSSTLLWARYCQMQLLQCVFLAWRKLTNISGKTKDGPDGTLCELTKNRSGIDLFASSRQLTSAVNSFSSWRHLVADEPDKTSMGVGVRPKPRRLPADTLFIKAQLSIVAQPRAKMLSYSSGRAIANSPSECLERRLRNGDSCLTQSTAELSRVLPRNRLDVVAESETSVLPHQQGTEYTEHAFRREVLTQSNDRKKEKLLVAKELLLFLSEFKEMIE